VEYAAGMNHASLAVAFALLLGPALSAQVIPRRETPNGAGLVSSSTSGRAAVLEVRGGVAGFASSAGHRSSVGGGVVQDAVSQAAVPGGGGFGGGGGGGCAAAPGRTGGPWSALLWLLAARLALGIRLRRDPLERA
jgi:hypothetical protein